MFVHLPPHLHYNCHIIICNDMCYNHSVLYNRPTHGVIWSYADSCRKNHNDTMIKDEQRLL